MFCDAEDSVLTLGCCSCSFCCCGKWYQSLAAPSFRELKGLNFVETASEHLLNHGQHGFIHVMGRVAYAELCASVSPAVKGKVCGYFWVSFHCSNKRELVTVD